MSQTPDKPRPTHAPVRFDDRIFQEDLAYASVTGIAVARLSRHRYESKGIPVGELRIKLDWTRSRSVTLDIGPGQDHEPAAILLHFRYVLTCHSSATAGS